MPTSSCNTTKNTGIQLVFFAQEHSASADNFVASAAGLARSIHEGTSGRACAVARGEVCVEGALGGDRGVAKALFGRDRDGRPELRVVGDPPPTPDREDVSQGSLPQLFDDTDLSEPDIEAPPHCLPCATTSCGSNSGCPETAESASTYSSSQSGNSRVMPLQQRR